MKRSQLTFTPRWGYWVLLACLLVNSGLMLAQDEKDSLEVLEYEPGAYAVVKDIVIEGNRKTRRPIVLREMSLKVGDTLWLDQLGEVVERQRRLLLNTNLFMDVQVLISTLNLERKETILRAVVRERWYVYPAVDFDLADRNFNVWWTEGQRSLSRINYGVKLRHSNLTGRRDKLTLGFQIGYTRKYELKYEIPYIDKAKVLGLELGVLLDQNREWNVGTDDGILQFYRLESSNVLERRRYRVRLVMRPKIQVKHGLRLERQSNTIDPSLASDVNPNFFGEGKTQQQFWGLQYRLEYDQRDVRPFPLKGDLTTFKAEKLGLTGRDDINRLNISLQHNHYQPIIGDRLNLLTIAKVKTDVERSQVPFFNRESLGFNQNFLRGYQYYVVDGLDYAFLKNTLRGKVLETRIRLPFVPYKRFSDIPMRLFLGVHGDVGAMRDPFDTSGNVLADRWLSSYGVGAYAVLWYGKIARFEATRNDLGEWGGYFSYSLAF
ncbi:MAG: BamA/TamA family outer membrane protein [Saprospiraceae bacterium]